jgi:hypothetical protein
MGTIDGQWASVSGPGEATKSHVPTWGNVIEIAPNLSFDGTIATDHFLARSLGH